MPCANAQLFSSLHWLLLLSNCLLSYNGVLYENKQFDRKLSQWRLLFLPQIIIKSLADCNTFNFKLLRNQPMMCDFVPHHHTTILSRQLNYQIEPCDVNTYVHWILSQLCWYHSRHIALEVSVPCDLPEPWNVVEKCKNTQRYDIAPSSTECADGSGLQR